MDSSLLELTHESPTTTQPLNITVQLRPHQLTLLHQCQCIENDYIPIDISRMPIIPNPSYSTFNTACKIRSRIGIIADKVGSGKSNVILSLIASDIEADATTTKFQSTYTYGLHNIIMLVDQEKRTSNINLIIIPHNLTSQWTSYVKAFFKTVPKYVIISKTKHLEELTIENIHEYRLIIVTCTFYSRLATLLKQCEIQLKRTIYDEVDSISLTSIDVLDSAFYWFVTASYANLLNPRGHGRYDRVTGRYIIVAEGMRAGGYIKHLFTSMHTSTGTNIQQHVCNLIIAKNSDTYIDQSISLPDIDVHYIRCRTPQSINVLHGLVDSHVIQCLNAGNVEGAIHYINPTHRSTEINIIDILLEKYTKSLHNVTTMMTYVTTQMQYDNDAQRALEIERLEKKHTDFSQKIASITARIKETDTCCICYDSITNKTIVNCCMNPFCFQCISKWVSQKHSCPLCKETINLDKMYVVCEGQALPNIEEVIDAREPEPSEAFEKLENLEILFGNINQQHPNNKILVFSTNEGIFNRIQDIIGNAGRTFKMLKGTNMSIANTVESYKNGELNTLIVNPEHYGSGLNLENTTDIIMLHKFDNEIEKQVIGRAQRYGRTTPLRIWYLLYANEIDT
jgi:SNF2 family DNA or RNA helicase